MTVSPGPDTRRRLAEFMEERRLDLGLRWQDVVTAAAAAGFPVSLKVLGSVRTGDAGIRPRTQRGIEAGLQWERGSVRAILDGGDPVHLSADDDPTLPGVRPAPAAVTDPAGELYRVAAGIAGEIGYARRSGIPDPEIFTDPFERNLWLTERKPEDQRILAIAALRSARPRRPPNSSTNPPIELAGLAAWGAA